MLWRVYMELVIFVMIFDGLFSVVILLLAGCENFVFLVRGT